MSVFYTVLAVIESAHHETKASTLKSGTRHGGKCIANSFNGKTAIVWQKQCHATYLTLFSAIHLLLQYAMSILCTQPLH